MLDLLAMLPRYSSWDVHERSMIDAAGFASQFTQRSTTYVRLPTPIKHDMHDAGRTNASQSTTRTATLTRKKTDCQEVVKMCESSSDKSVEYHMFRELNLFSLLFEGSSVSFARRSANTAAHAAIREAVIQESSSCTFDLIPTRLIIEPVQSDMIRH